MENPANAFVEDFIGENRALKRLQVTRVEEVMETDETEHEQLAAAGSGSADANATVADGVGDDFAVSPTDNAQTALSRMIQADRGALPVVEDGEMVGVVTQESIRQQHDTLEAE